MNRIPVYLRRLIVRAIEDAIVLLVMRLIIRLLAEGIAMARDWFVTLFV